MAEVRDKYHISLNDKGYMLRGAPDKVAYARSIISSQIQRMAISDLAYSDFSGQGLFYLAQTDWSAGFKDEKKWSDDAKFYYSTNIDAYSEQGLIKLRYDVGNGMLPDAEVITSGLYGSFKYDASNQENCYLLATSSNGNGGTDSPSIYYRTSLTLGSWILAVQLDNTLRSMITCMLLSHNHLFYGSAPLGTDTTRTVRDIYGGTTTDHATAIATAMGWSSDPTICRAMVEINNVIYVGLDRITDNLCGVAKTSDLGANWSKLFDISGYNFIADMIEYQGNLYYLLDKGNGRGNGLELRMYDISSSTDLLIANFPQGRAHNKWTDGSGTEYTYARGTGGRYMHVLQGKLIFVVPIGNAIGNADLYAELYEYDGNNLIQLLKRDESKKDLGDTTGTSDATFYLHEGGIKHKDELFFGNLIYDGESLFNDSKNYNNDNNKYIVPMLSDGSIIIYAGALGTYQQTYQTEQRQPDVYRSATDKNFLVLNEMSPITSVDKLLYSVTILFEVFDEGESIKIQYSIDNMESWVTVGTASKVLDGTNIKKTFVIPGNIIFNKIWYKIFLNGDGTSTPKLKDFIMAYKPMPDYKNRWDLRLNFSDGVKLLNKQNEERTGQELESELWNEKVIKQRVVFKDVDYAECSLVSAMTSAATSALVDKTKRFPRQGRIRAVSGNVAEEMTYTSAHTNKLLGISRAKRGTFARAYSAGQQLDNAYDVYIEDIKSEINFTDEQKTEHIAQLLLIES